MRKHLLIHSLVVFFLMLLSGCWDEQLLKDVTLIESQAFDIGSNEDLIKTTISIVRTDSNTKIPTNSVVVSAEGKSSRDARVELDKKIGSELFASKNKVTLISKEIAERDIYALLDVNFRSPLSALTAKLVVTDGESGPFLYAKPDNPPLIGDYLNDLISSAEKVGTVPETDLQNTLKVLFDEGKDLILPTITNLSDHRGAIITGSALFNDRRMTGSLNSFQTSLLLLLGNSKKGQHRLTRMVNEDARNDLYNYVTVDVTNIKRDLKLRKQPNDNYTVHIELVLDLNVVEYPADHLYKPRTIKKLNDTLSGELTKEANEILDILKASNCDYLGIGRHVSASYYSDWTKINWKDVYPNVSMKTNVVAKINTHGIIN